jgi:hypothetical protein
MPVRNVSILIILVVWCWPCAGEARGQAPATDAPLPRGPEAGGTGGTEAERDLERTQQQLKELSQAQAQAGGAQEIDRLKAQLELQQKQIEVLLKMTQMLADQVKKQPAAGEAVEKLQEQAAGQEAQLQKAAQRDKELANAHDDLVERIDAVTRNGWELPATLRELFTPTRNNESPLAIYGLLSQDFNAFSKQNSTFRAPTMQLHPYVFLNERWMFSANIIFLSSSIVMCRMQAEWFLNDNWTVVAGRFYSPIGFYTERIRLDWVLRTPDPPLMFNQVYPDQLFFDGLQLRGARYIYDSPFKLEYVGFVANGLSVPGANLSPKTYSDLSNFTDSGNDVNGAKAWGGRIGISIPTIGFIAGLSGLANNAYDQAGHNLTLWDIDVNYHRGNWDARFEMAQMNQATPSEPIRRHGLYAQVAYRQYNNPNPYLQKLEGVFRFDHVRFAGINLQQTGINFGGYELLYARMPLDRNRYTVGANYWFYPSLVLKLAFEFYDELGVPSLRDNGFIGQVAWGW